MKPSLFIPAGLWGLGGTGLMLWNAPAETVSLPIMALVMILLMGALGGHFTDREDRRALIVGMVWWGGFAGLMGLLGLTGHGMAMLGPILTAFFPLLIFARSAQHVPVIARLHTWAFPHASFENIAEKMRDIVEEIKTDHARNTTSTRWPTFTVSVQTKATHFVFAPGVVVFSLQGFPNRQHWEHWTREIDKGLNARLGMVTLSTTDHQRLRGKQLVLTFEGDSAHDVLVRKRKALASQPTDLNLVTT